MKQFMFLSLIISAICFFVFLLSYFYPAIYTNFSLVSSKALSEPWRIITHMFLHGSLLHLGGNLFALLLFGTILEHRIGSINFLLVFFSAGIASSIADILFYSSTIGASGAIFGVMGCLAILRPKLIVWVLGVPMYMIIAVGVWALLDFAGFFYPDNVAHAAHLFGLGFGVILGLWFRPIYKDIRRQKTKEEKVMSDKELDKWEERHMR